MDLKLAFVQSMQSQGLRKLAAQAIFEDVRTKRPPYAKAIVRLVVDMLRVDLLLWWPWLLVPFALPICWLWLRWRVHRALRRLQVPMRKVTIGVLPQRKKPPR
jgi:hypothetical protein